MTIILIKSDKNSYNINFVVSVLIVYVICGNSHFSISKSDYPVYELRCNNETNYKDMYEAGLILDFIIKIYKNPLADKYIFCQGHDTSHHYRIDFWERIKYITSTDYFFKNSYGGLYCIYIHTFKTNHYLKSWVADVDKYILKEHVLKESIFDINITSPCCATFFVTHKRIKQNKLYMYILLRKYLTAFVVKNVYIKVGKITSNKRAALYMEYYWGKLFSSANESVLIPPDCANNLKIID